MIWLFPHSTTFSRALLMTLFWISGCSSPEQRATDRQTPTPSHTFSVEDRRIAKTLSLGANQFQASMSDYDHAVLCSIAVQTITDQLNKGGLMTEDQQKGFLQVQSTYALQMAATGKTDAQIAQDRLRAEIAHPDQSERARLAIGCLRQLT